MIELKIQYLKNDGSPIIAKTYKKATDFMLALSDLTTLQETENAFRVCYVNDEILSLACTDDLLVEVDAKVFKKYKELSDALPEEIREDKKQLLTLFLDLEEIKLYCQKYKKNYFEFSGVTRLKDKRKNVLYTEDSKELPSTSYLFLTQDVNKVYSICTDTKISKFFMNVEDVEYLDVLLMSSSGYFPEYVYSMIHDIDYKEIYDNLFKLQG